jgi:hypothetical protein
MYDRLAGNWKPPSAPDSLQRELAPPAADGQNLGFYK